MNKALFNNLHKLTIKDCFDLYIHKSNNYNYKFKNEKIEVSGFGYYNKKYPKQGDHRFYLELSIEQRKEGEALAVIMMNPSNTFPEIMLMYGKEASNRKQEIDRQHYTIPNQRPKDKHCGKI